MIMKLVVNNAYGGFGLGVAEEFEDFFDKFADEMSDRTDEELVAFVENHSDDCGDLVIVEIPDDATDWEIEEYDGWESVIYVGDGKIKHA